MKLISFIAVWLSMVAALSATEVDPTPLERQVDRAVTIVFGRVESVTIHDGSGRALSDGSARTGPGERNELRLHVVLDVKRVMKGAVPESQVKVTLPLWRMWHDTLNSARAVYEKKDFIFFLTPDFRPSSSAEFLHLDLEESVIKAEIERQKRPNQALQHNDPSCHGSCFRTPRASRDRG